MIYRNKDTCIFYYIFFSVIDPMLTKNKRTLDEKKSSKKRYSTFGSLPLFQPTHCFAEPTLGSQSNDSVRKERIILRFPSISGFPPLPPPNCKELFNQYNECVREHEIYKQQNNSNCISILETAVYCKHYP
jgi:hypothetical protein